MQTLNEEKEISQLIESSKVIVVNNVDDLRNITEQIKRSKGWQAKISETFDPIVDKAYKSHKEAITQRDKYLKPLQDFDKRSKASIIDYNKRIESEQRERERIANEALAKVAEAKKQELIQKAESLPNEWEAEVLKEKAQEIKPFTVDVQKNVVESAGLSIRRTWKARVVDFEKVPREYLLLNESLLNSQAKIAEVRMAGISGIEFYEEQSASVRA